MKIAEFITQTKTELITVNDTVTLKALLYIT